MESFLPTTDEMRGFLTSIKQEPDDDELRLIFADWLEERGDARGSLIRAQIEREGLCDYDSHSRLLDHQIEDALRTMHVWLNLNSGWEMRRGLLHRTISHTEQEPIKATEIDQLDWPWEWTDTLTLFNLTFDRKQAQSLAALPLLKHLNALHLSNIQLDSPSATELAQSPFLGNLVELELMDVSETDVGEGFLELILAIPKLALLRLFDCEGQATTIAEIAKSPMMAQLKHLDLYRNYLRDDGAKAIAQASCPKLETLKLGSCQIGSAGLSALAQGQFECLTRLHLNSNDIDEESMQALTWGTILERLTALDLGSNPICDKAIRELARCSALSNLKSLALEFTHFEEIGMRTLAQSPHLRKLEILTLSYVAIGDAGLKSLCESPYLTNLINLDLQGVECTDDGVQALARSGSVESLRELSLYDNNLTHQGVAELARSTSLRQLSKLYLDSNPLGDEGIEAMLKGEWNLDELGLSCTGITDRGVEALSGHPGSASLSSINLGRNDITEAGAQSLIDSPYLSNLMVLYIDDSNLAPSIQNALRERFDEQGTEITDLSEDL